MKTESTTLMPEGAAITLNELEAFLTHEAALLDEWRLEEWQSFLAPDATYLIPPLDQPDASPDEALFLVADDIDRIRSRVKQMLGEALWAEQPRSRTRRLVTNCRILEDRGSEIQMTANFAVWRFQQDQTDVYVGKYVHTLIRAGSGLLFRERKAVLDHETLRPHGKLSFIL
jgi:p-cumate 2,3-dioxygenase beta subunit